MGKTVRTPELDERILDGISRGIPLAELCRTEGIDRTIVYDWRKADEDFDQRFARAREMGFDAIAEEALAIADDGTNDFMKRQKGEEEVDAYDAEHVQRSKLRVETRLKLLAKWDPKRYGDAMLHKHADADGNKRPIDDIERMTRLASIFSEIAQSNDEHSDDAG